MQSPLHFLNRATAFIVHMVRNTLKYVANKYMKAFDKDLKTIYTTANEEAARKQLEAVTEKWSE